MILSQLAPALNSALAAATHCTAETTDFSRRFQSMLNHSDSWRQAPAPAPTGDDDPLTVLEHLPRALEYASEANPSMRELIDAISAISTRLHWYKRPPSGDAGFMQKHALTTLVGHRGLIPNKDWRIGLVLTSPQVNYPAHKHPPEEMYLVLSPGAWCNANQDWHSPGIGSTVYNPRNIEHAMRSEQEPLFAVWCQAI